MGDDGDDVNGTARKGAMGDAIITMNQGQSTLNLEFY
jgi:hypothetical protein